MVDEPIPEQPKSVHDLPGIHTPSGEHVVIPPEDAERLAASYKAGARFHLPVMEDPPPMPPGHRVGVEIPNEGLWCATCKWYSLKAPAGVTAPHGWCTSEYYQAATGTGAIPKPARRWCSDYWEPAAGLTYPDEDAY